MTGSLTPTAASARPQAPGRLGLVQAFLNTADIETGTDTIATQAGLRRWLCDNGLGSVDMSGGDLARTIELREALRDALEINAHAPQPGDSPSAARLSRAAAGVPLRIEASAAAPRVVAAGPGIDAVLGTLLAIAVEAAADGSWSRLKVCRNDACRWAFWDGSRNRSGLWCTMAVCGNRAKGRAFRYREARNGL